jgi:predicted metal-dependent phosphoesterase TrpH
MSDVMLLGVLRMPISDEPDAMTLRQFVGRARQAADRIEADAIELERLTKERDEWAQKATDWRRKYGELRWPGLTNEIRATAAKE